MTVRDARLLIVALVASAALVVVYVANGGGEFEPTPPGDPCTHKSQSVDEGLFGTVERVGLTALDGAACDLRISRESLLLGLTGERELSIDDDTRNDAFRNGLKRAIDEEQHAGRLGAVEATLLRAGVDILPVDALLDRVFQTG
jgi:hypothetical protein